MANSASEIGLRCVRVATVRTVSAAGHVLAQPNVRDLPALRDRASLKPYSTRIGRELIQLKMRDLGLEHQASSPSTLSPRKTL
jgi:hypothetical protein